MIFSFASVTRRDRPCCLFSGRTRKRCTMYQVSRLVGPNVNSLTFPRIMTNRRGRKVCRLKSGVANATQSRDIARQSRANKNNNYKGLPHFPSGISREKNHLNI